MDYASVSRDGQPYFARNDLASRAGRPMCEILFADGVWFLADPETDLRNSRLSLREPWP